MPQEEHKNEITVDELAAMTASGFHDLQERMAVLASKEDLAGLQGEMKDNFHNLQQDMAARFDLVLKTIRQNYDQRLGRAEENIRELQEHH